MQSAIGWDVERFDGVVQSKVGCTLSHLNLWEQHAKRAGSTAILVFEDDARLCRSIVKEDEEAIADFLNDDTRGAMLLGWHPHLHRVNRARGRAKRGYALDLHAYILKADYARHLVERYASTLRSRLHQKFAPCGTIDTIFLLEPVTTRCCSFSTR